MERLQTARLYAQAVAPEARRGATSAFVVDQRPREPGELWVGVATRGGDQVPGGRTSLVLSGAEHLDLSQPLAGLLVDEWVEVVPGAEETTGLALHYDAPGAEPPQTILLAVPPDTRPGWSVEALEEILLETLELAKLRLVDVDSLTAWGHFLPAVFLAFNAAADTVATDLRRAAPP